MVVVVVVGATVVAVVDCGAVAVEVVEDGAVPGGGNEMTVDVVALVPVEAVDDEDVVVAPVVTVGAVGPVAKAVVAGEVLTVAGVELLATCGGATT